MATFAVSEVQRGVALGAAHSLLQAVAEGVSPAENVEKLLGIGGGSAGKTALEAWAHLVGTEVATRATIAQAFASGQIKATFKAWLRRAAEAADAPACVGETLRQFGALRWDEATLRRFGGYGMAPPREVASARRFLVTRYDGATRRMSPICGFVERSASATEHAALVRLGDVATLPAVLGLRLRVFRYHDRLDPSRYADNAPAVYLMADPGTGLATPPWVAPGVGGLGPVDVVAEDGDHGVVDAALLMDYLDNLMDRWAGGRPTDRLSPAAFAAFVDAKAARVRQGRPVDMASGEAAMITFSHLSQLHLAGRGHDRVVLRGLTAPGYDGSLAELGPYDPASGRFQVFLAKAKDPYKAILIRPQNLAYLKPDGTTPDPDRPLPVPQHDAPAADGDQ